MNSSAKNVSEYLVTQVASDIDTLEDLSPKEREEKRQKRKSEILKSDFIGVSVCVISALIKFIIGLTTNSLAIESDAIDSLTESYSYIISFLGITLAHKKPNKKHPNGFGRIEFLTAVIGGVLVIVTGWHYFESSLRRIASPQASNVTSLQLLIVAITIVGKIYLFFDDRKAGKEYNSTGLITASRSALLSTFSTVLVIFAAIVYHYLNIDIDGWVGLIIAIFMIFAGIIGIKNGMSSIIGKPIKRQVGVEITDILLQNPPIIGVYDLRLNDNGASIIRGTVNAEVPNTTSVEDTYNAFRNARAEVYRKLGIDLTIGLITVNYCDTEIHPLFNSINAEILSLEGIQNFHGFKWNKERNEVDVHVIVDFDKLNDDKLEQQIQDIIHKYIPDSSVLVEFNVNYLEDQSVNRIPACKVSY